MKEYLVVSEDNYSNKVRGEYELQGYMALLQGQDTEFTIYERDCIGVWVEAEFYCDHEYYAMNLHGGWVEQCENMSDVPYGCYEHRREVA